MPLVSGGRRVAKKRFCFRSREFTPEQARQTAKELLATVALGGEPPRRQAADDTSSMVSAEDLVDLITKVRHSGAWFGPRSDEFLDSLLRCARAYASVFISAKWQRWLDGLVRKAREATP
jgi:hypothetical protein